jgi:protocatechuate 4,5-dioxygenase beta chain
MAELAAVIASTHHPFYYRASTSTGADRPPFADEWVAKIERFRETLTRAEPDVLVMVGSDHFHQLWLDNMPQFLVGKAPFFDANFYNEEREFGLPRMLLRGEEELAAHLLRDGLDRGFDLAFSNELRIDHSITCPIITLRPQADLPIVPVYTNIFAPPLPQPKRFVQLGRAIREMVESWDSDRRVAVIGTGHLSLELGGPRQFGEHGPDPEFDRKAVEWIASGDIEGCLAEVSLDSLHAPGNATHGFMDFMLMMGVAGEGQQADHVDTLDLFHTMEAYFTWYPNGLPQPREAAVAPAAVTR